MKNMARNDCQVLLICRESVPVGVRLEYDPVNAASNALHSEVRGKAAVRTHYMPFRLPEAQHAQEGPRSNHLGDINRKIFRRIGIYPNF